MGPPSWILTIDVLVQGKEKGFSLEGNAKAVSITGAKEKVASSAGNANGDRSEGMLRNTLEDLRAGWVSSPLLQLEGCLATISHQEFMHVLVRAGLFEARPCRPLCENVLHGRGSMERLTVSVHNRQKHYGSQYE